MSTVVSDEEGSFGPDVGLGRPQQLRQGLAPAQSGELATRRLILASTTCNSAIMEDIIQELLKLKHSSALIISRYLFFSLAIFR